MSTGNARDSRLEKLSRFQVTHGGPRPGAGRKKGGANRATEEAIAHAEAGGEMPLDFLLRIMRDQEADEVKRIDCAKAAAPYLHAKLANVEAKITGELAIGRVIYPGLDD